MGYTRKVLAEKKLNEKAVFYTDDFILHMTESVHVHFRNFRLELSMEEWKKFVKGFLVSWVRWFLRGRPHYQPTAFYWEMFRAQVHPVAGAGKQSVIRGKEMLVELSQFADYIHLHHRNTRYEFTVDEFLEYADEITKARDAIRAMDIMQDYPKRIGYDHIMQPKFRVTESKNIGRFTVHDKRFPDGNIRTHDSVIFDESTGTWKQQISYHDIKPRRSLFFEKGFRKISMLTQQAMKKIWQK